MDDPSMVDNIGYQAELQSLRGREDIINDEAECNLAEATQTVFELSNHLGERVKELTNISIRSQQHLMAPVQRLNVIEGKTKENMCTGCHHHTGNCSISPQLFQLFCRAVRTLFLLTLGLLLVDAQTKCSDDSDTLFSGRLTRLRDYAARCKQVEENACTERQKLFTIEGGPLGELGNTMITLVHALWIAEHNNGILLLPAFLAAPNQTLSNFNLSTLHRCYCIINHGTHNNETELKDIIARKREVIRHPSGFYYGMFEHYGHDKHKPDFLPPYSDAMLKEIAHTFLTVYSALWAHPSCHILDQSTALVLQQLEDSSLSYTAVHKHIGEGDCSQNMYTVFPTAEFDTKQLPMNRCDPLSLGISIKPNPLSLDISIMPNRILYDIIT